MVRGCLCENFTFAAASPALARCYGYSSCFAPCFTQSPPVAVHCRRRRNQYPLRSRKSADGDGGRSSKRRRYEMRPRDVPSRDRSTGAAPPPAQPARDRNRHGSDRGRGLDVGAYAANILSVRTAGQHAFVLLHGLALSLADLVF